jgi:formamidopyrimidine-DNA glycosylase
MAERPDLEYVLPILAKELDGVRVTGVRVKKPVVLRVAVAGGFDNAVVGKRVASVGRRAHFAVFALEGDGEPVEMIVAPMLAGRFALAKASEKSTGDLAVAFVLEDGRELRYRDDVQMGKVYVVPRGKYDAVPGFAHIGIDVLDAKKFTRAAFRALARSRRDQAKVFLMDKSALDAFGNAYADETLFEAGVHPKTFVRGLDDETLDRLHDAMVKVLTEARDTIRKSKPPLDEKLRDFVKVRNREGEPCPRCGTKIRAAGVHGHDAFFCPQCQPETRKSAIVDWRRLKGGG